MLIKVFLSRPGTMLAGAKFGKYAIEGLAHVNEDLIRSGRIPPLYKSGVRYVRDRDGEETFIDAPHVIRQGGADCSSLAAYRLGELWAAGESGAGIHIHWRGYSDGYRLYHVTVRRADGAIEDPSRLLGM